MMDLDTFQNEVEVCIPVPEDVQWEHYDASASQADLRLPSLSTAYLAGAEYRVIFCREQVIYTISYSDGDWSMTLEATGVCVAAQATSLPETLHKIRKSLELLRSHNL
jgi:hypothetical protein